MIVQHNILAMNANRNVNINTTKSSASTKKLASGYRINSSADDAAGLTISEKMRKLIHGLSQGSINAQDGISMVQTAEGALNEVHDMIQRMNELALQAANETNSDSDRAALQLEFEHLQDEIDRISNTTTFNDKLLFSSGEKEVDFNDVSAVRAGFNGEIKNKINGIDNGKIDIDNTQNQPGTYSLRSVERVATFATPRQVTGNIDLSNLTGDLVINDKGYSIDGVEYSYTGNYKLFGETSQKVIIMNPKKTNINIANGTKLGNLEIKKNENVTLTLEGISNIDNVSVESGGYLYVKGNASSQISINDINNAGVIYLETETNINGTFNNNSTTCVRNYSKLNLAKDFTNRGSLQISSGSRLEVNGTFTNNKSVLNSGTVYVSGDINNNSENNYSFSSSGTMVIEGNMINSKSMNISGGTTTIKGNVSNEGKTDVSGKFIVEGDMTNNNILNVNHSGNVIAQGELINNRNIIVDGGGILTPKANLSNNSNITINTFGTLDGANAAINNNGSIKVEDHYSINGTVQGNNIQHLNTITLNLSKLSDVSLSDTYFEVRDRADSPYINAQANRIYKIKGQTSHYSIDDIKIISGNVTVNVLDEPVYIGELNIASGAQINIEGPGKLVADTFTDNAPIDNPKFFKYFNGNIDMGSINDTLEINDYGYKLANDPLKYYYTSTIILKGSIDNDGPNSDKDVDIIINDNRNIRVDDSNNCIVNSVTLNSSGVSIYGQKLVATEIYNTHNISSNDELYKIGTDQIDVGNITGTLTIGDDYYQYGNSFPKLYNEGAYYFSGDNKEANIHITSSNEIIVDDKCYVGKVIYDSDSKAMVNGDGKLICKEVTYNKAGIIEGEDIIVLSKNEIDLSKVNDTLIITDNGYTMDNVNYQVDKNEGITLKGNSAKDIYIDSERIVSLFEVKATGKFTIVSPTKGSVQVVGDTVISNLVAQTGSELNIYGDGPLHIDGESFNMGTLTNKVEEVIQEGEFNNLGKFVNQSLFINQSIINNADEGEFINKAIIENEGIINNYSHFENDIEGLFTNNKFIYNIGEFNNKTGALFDNNNVIENKYKFRNKGTLDNYDGRIDNYYSVAGLVLGNQPIYIYDTSRTEKSWDIQAGAEKDNKVEIDIFQMNARVLGIQKDRVNIRTSEDTTNALEGINYALDRLSKQRSMLGSYQNRLEHTIRNLDNTVENTTSAESGIRDANMAKEMVEFSNNNILLQSAQSMLAQANQINEGVLRLLS